MMMWEKCREGFLPVGLINEKVGKMGNRKDDIFRMWVW